MYILYIYIYIYIYNNKLSSYKRPFSVGLYFGCFGVYFDFSGGCSWRMALRQIFVFGVGGSYSIGDIYYDISVAMGLSPEEKEKTAEAPDAAAAGCNLSLRLLI